jgi:hypothetical protein
MSTHQVLEIFSPAIRQRIDSRKGLHKDFPTKQKDQGTRQ